jgi:hypothetical protein
MKRLILAVTSWGMGAAENQSGPVATFGWT